MSKPDFFKLNPAQIKPTRFWKRLVIMISGIWMINVTLGQALYIGVETGRFGIDHNHLIIVSQIDNIQQYHDLSAYQKVALVLNTDTFTFINNPSSLSYSNSYLVEQSFLYYHLYFSQYPLITIRSDSMIVDEPKVPALFSYADADQIVFSLIGIELRGGISQLYPKKTYDLEFWEDSTGSVTVDYQFGNLRTDDDWILDAMYNEPLRIRSYLAHKLWLQMHQPHYSEEAPDARAGADVMYAEVFLNGDYNGIYLLSEQPDRKLFQLAEFEEEMHGELYKGISWGAPTFTSLPDYSDTSRIWSGYEFRYPEEEQLTDWSNLYNFTDFVMNAPEEIFEEFIWNYFHHQNVIDYYLFLNLLRATDNTGKNIYLAKYDIGYPYFYSPWDLDGCFGTIWNGTNDSTTNDLLSNGFYDRATALNTGNFNQQITESWYHFRKNTLGAEKLQLSFSETFYQLKNHKVYERESEVFPDFQFGEQEFLYLINWTSARLAYLDSCFHYNVGIENNLSSHNREIILFPNPAKDQICIGMVTASNFHQYRVLNLSGKPVMEGLFPASGCIDVSRLQPGIYFLKTCNRVSRFIIW